MQLVIETGAAEFEGALLQADIVIHLAGINRPDTGFEWHRAG